MASCTQPSVYLGLGMRSQTTCKISVFYTPAGQLGCPKIVLDIYNICNVHVACNFHACLKKHACHSIVSIVLYACHMQHALKAFKIPAYRVHVTC